MTNEVNIQTLISEMQNIELKLAEFNDWQIEAEKRLNKIEESLEKYIALRRKNEGDR